MREKTTIDNISQRFWEKVKKSEGCWEWTGYCSKVGHGQFQTLEKVDYAHRYSWVLHNGEIPDGLCVLHKCDNPSCVNPEHLFLGTQQDNIIDMYKKERSGRTKMNKEQVEMIRSEYSPHKNTQSMLAEKYGVEVYVIGRIVRNETYKYFEATAK